MSKTQPAEHLLLLLILVAAILLRFWNLGTDSITHDELSALFRLQHNSVWEVIKAVGIQHDAHPVGAQVFLYYWTNWLGDSPYVLRLPFAVAGVLAVYTAFLLGRLLFSSTTGLLVATCMAVLEYPIIYTQLARPYSFGLFFTMAAAYFLFRFCKQNNKRSLSLGLFVLFTVLSCYTHYFALMQVALLSIAGLFLVPKTYLKQYIMALVAIALFFVPHLGIFFQQITYKGLDWLKEPGMGFLPEYIWYVFNYSWWVLALIVTLVVGLFFFRKEALGKINLQVVMLLLFVVPFLVGFCYSLWVKPVLQPSLLLFAFPFLLLLLFSFVGKQSKAVMSVATVLILSAGIFSTVVANGFYNKHHFAPYQPIVDKTYQWSEQYGSENISRIINVGEPFFVDYYFNQHKKHPKVLTYDINKKEQLLDLQALVNNTNTSYFMYAWSNGYHPQEIIEVIKEKYPYLVERQWYFNAEAYLFSQQSKSKLEEEVLFTSDCSVSSTCEGWENVTEDTLICIDKTMEFGPTFQTPLSKLNVNRYDVFSFSAVIDIPTGFSDATLVLSFERLGKSLAWKSSNFSHFISSAGKRTFFVSHHLPPEAYEELEDVIVKAYVWNNQQQSFCIEEVQFKVEKGNPVLYDKYYIPE